MYIATIPNRNSPPAILLRESYREQGKVKNRTLANLSSLPPQSIDVLRHSLKGESLVSTDALEIVEDGSPAHGHVDAVMAAMRRLGFSRLICSRRSRQRDLVVAMVAARILEPKSNWQPRSGGRIRHCLRYWTSVMLMKTTFTMRWTGCWNVRTALKTSWQAATLRRMPWRLYDLTSSYFEGQTCPLAALGHDRDGKKGKLQVNYGLLTNRKGIPVAVSVFKGNTGDPKTLMPQVKKMRDAFGIEQFVMVGDRGMLTQKQVDELHDIDGVDWIGALRPEAIKKLATNGAIQMGLFDERNLFEIKHPDFPGERLIACRNVELGSQASNQAREFASGHRQGTG